MSKSQSKVTDEDREALFKFGGIYLLELLGLDFMSKKPNKNTPHEEALSIQCTALINYFFMIVQSDKDEYSSRIISPMALRSFLEVIANINYLVLQKDNSEVASRYLNASNHTVEGLWGAFKGKSTPHQYWCDLSITARIQLLQDRVSTNKSPLDLKEMYYHLSSFIHADPSHITTASVDYKRLYTFYHMSMTYLLIFLDDILNEDGVTNGSLTLYSIAKSKLIQEEKKRRPSQKQIRFYKSILEMPGIKQG